MQLMENNDIKFISSWGGEKTEMCQTTHYDVITYRVIIYSEFCENQVTSFQGGCSQFYPTYKCRCHKKGLIYKVGAFIAEDVKKALSDF